MQEKILKVPYISQTEDFIEKEWHERACGVTGVAIILKYFGEDVHVMDLINEAVMIGGYQNGMWIHDGLVRLFRNHGLHAYSEEFRSIKVDFVENKFLENEFESKLIDGGIAKIASEIEKGNPCLVSVKAGFANNNQSHLVVIVGVKRDEDGVSGFYIHDTDDRDGNRRSEQFVDLQKFLGFWKKFAVFPRQIA